jgi:AcrR family transcriptional regulator
MKSAARGKTRIRHRYVPENAYTRGAQTRARLIGSALKLFGQRGFDGASTRDIAAAAGLNAPALQYYFNNKEGLYAACAEHIVAQAWTGMKDVVLAAERLVGGRATDAVLIEAFCAIQVKLADFLTGAAGDWLLWIAREEMAAGPARGFRLIHRQRDRIMRVKAAIIARLLRRAARDAECALRAMSLTGEVLYFHFMRRGALGELGWKAIDAPGLALIKRIVREQTTSALRALRTPARTPRTSGVARPRSRRPVSAASPS